MMPPQVNLAVAAAEGGMVRLLLVIDGRETVMMMSRAAAANMACRLIEALR